MTDEELYSSLLCKAAENVKDNPAYIMAQHRYERALDEQFKITGGGRIGFFPSAGARQLAKKSDSDATLLLRQEFIRLLDKHGIDKAYTIAISYIPDPNKI